MSSLRPFALVLALGPLFACSEAALPPCPPGTLDADGLCRRGCSADTECLDTETCSPALGVCVRRDVTPPPDPPRIVRFTADPSTITQPGQTVTFDYEVENATEVEITPGILPRTTSLSGLVEHGVEDSTTFTLTARGDGEVTEEVTVVLMGGRVAIASFTASPERVREGEPVQLSWTVMNAAAGTIRISDPQQGRWLSTNAVASGQASDTPPSLPVEYWIEATGSTGETVRASARVFRVHDGAPVVVSFDAHPSTIRAEDTALVTWETSGATRLDLSDGTGWTSAATDALEVARGFRLVGPLESREYVAGLQGPGGRTSDRTTLAIEGGTTGTEPVFTSAFVEPERRGQNSGSAQLTARWEADGADTVTVYANDVFVAELGANDRRSLSAMVQQNIAVKLVAERAGAVAEANLTSYFIVPEQEPNGDVQQADPVDEVARAGFVLLRDVDSDLFSLDVPEGGRIEAVLVARDSNNCEGNTSSLVFGLYLSDGASLLAEAVLDGNGCPVIHVDHLSAGKYFLRVSGGPDLGDGSDYVLLARALGPTCGDGVKEGTETCDDGNRSPLDGCDGFCVAEEAPGYEATRRPIQTLPQITLPPIPVTLRPTGEAGASSAELAFPTPFTFYGRRYAGLVVHSSGYVTFRPAPDDRGAPAVIP
ncbi:hypothetical protein L6R52_30100, partial [Myxococcota bacterium]|nr:hypothetical protein [Myxococcota bacterium]